ncbi:hypothetical protein [Candidatus Protochlamydia phocaeensis]|uniref:hypothetical protein n=1 Tax=Candidatus Protochlamydia phocaeensis TaxID=1414722 RepID=UPI0008383DB9|nr:hypothetical protein [Candidatus Protochlamydia phocaeensis]
MNPYSSNGAYSQFHLVTEGFVNGIDMGYKANRNAAGEFTLLGPKSKTKCEKGNVVYLRVADFINNHKIALTKNEQSFRELNELKSCLNDRVTEIKASTTGIWSFFRTLFSWSWTERQRKIEKGEYLHALMKFVGNVIESKDRLALEGKESEETPIKTPSPETLTPIPTTNHVTSIPTPPLPFIPNPPSPPIGNPIPQPIHSIPLPPSTTTNSFPLPHLMPKEEPKPFEGEPLPPNFSGTDWKTLDFEAIKKQVEEIEAYLKAMNVVITRVDAKTKKMTDLQSENTKLGKDIDGYESQLEGIEANYQKIKMDHELGDLIPETKLYKPTKEGFEEYSFFSDAEYDKRMKSQEFKDDRPVKGQKRSAAFQSIDQVRKDVLENKEWALNKIEENERQLSLLKVKDGEVPADKFEWTLRQKKSSIHKWNVELRNRKAKLAGKEKAGAKFFEQRAKLAAAISNQGEAEKSRLARLQKENNKKLEYNDKDLFQRVIPELA